MITPRSARLEEKKQRRRILFTVVGSIAVLLFLAIFGVRILINFSLFMDTIRGNSPDVVEKGAVLLAPVLDPLPEATNSSTLIVNAKATPGFIFSLYVNGDTAKKVTVPDDGNLMFNDIMLQSGENQIYAQIKNEKGEESGLSETQKVVVKKTKPALEVTSPSDGDTVKGEQNTVTITGRTEEDITVTVNDRFVLIDSTYNFSYQHHLNEGENQIKIIARDTAGNTDEITRTIKYEK